MKKAKCERLLKKRTWTEIEAMKLLGMLSSGFYKYVKSEGYSLCNGVLMIDKKKVIQWAIDNKKDIPAPFYKYYVQEILPENEKNKPITKTEELIYKGLMKLCKYNFKQRYYTRKDYLSLVKSLIRIAGFNIATPQKTAIALEEALKTVRIYKIIKIKQKLDIRFMPDKSNDYENWLSLVKFVLLKQRVYITTSKPPAGNLGKISVNTIYKLMQEINIYNFS